MHTWTERLRHLIVRADAKSDKLVDLLSACRDEDDVGVAEGAQLPEHLQPGDPRQPDVQEHHVGLTVAQRGQRALRRRRPPSRRTRPPPGTHAGRCGYAALHRRPTPFASLTPVDEPALTADRPGERPPPRPLRGQRPHQSQSPDNSMMGLPHPLSAGRTEHRSRQARTGPLPRPSICPASVARLLLARAAGGRRGTTGKDYRPIIPPIPAPIGPIPAPDE